MAKEIVDYDNDCVGCEHCINCGRGDYPVWVLECDGCGEAGTEGEIELYEYNDLELCKECLLYEWLRTEKAERIQKFLLDCNVHELLAEEYDKVEVDE